MVLDIIEVSQKQAYIFSSNRLKKNITNSASIAYVTSSTFFKDAVKTFDEEKNVVYSGGGHTVLQFEDEQEAVDFNKCITRLLLDKFPTMEVYVKTIKYDDNKTPHDNIKALIEGLEIKKSERKSAFKKGSYGIEKIDSNTRLPEIRRNKKEEQDFIEDENKYIPDGFKPVSVFEDLGGIKNKSNFVAIIHIDGNGMGKRVNDFQEKYGGTGKSWEDFRKQIQLFSEAIDSDFKDAYREMTDEVGNRIRTGGLDDLELKDNGFPIRRIITSGDDICYVSDGRIGIESARIFIEKLNAKINKADGKSYNACAGIAIVHTNYPFFRAYDIAEVLCSNAKAFGAYLSGEDNGASVSALDWHIEYGEMGDDLASIRSLYKNEEGKLLNMRPYIISASDSVNSMEPFRQYKNFKKVLRCVSDDKGYARGSIKELRTVLRRKEEDVRYYLKYHRIDSLVSDCYQGIYEETDISKIGTGQSLEGNLYIKTFDGKDRSIMFDAIEIMDTYIDLDR